MSKFYITNAIAYVNGAPHLGHALELVQGDALARYHRMIGDDTRFLVGTDEFGSKNHQTAKDKGMSAQELADLNSARFRELHEVFGASQDDFIRTTEDRHQKGAQKLWQMIEDAGYFYKKDYKGLYCSGCEAFVMEKDLVNGKCGNYPRAPKELSETNLFFKLSEFGDVLREKIESGEFEIRPESRKNEILSLIKEGLRDVSFSRPSSTLPWGVTVPGHDDQVMYVWCDALSNYLTALGFAEGGELVERYWPADVHLVGKDITRFHCCIWPAMLLAAGLPLPKAVYAHGFVTNEGQKMGKSLGNAVDPFEIVETFGKEAVRYYLLREIPTGSDGDYSDERFRALYRDELQNTFGNLERRVVSMTLKYFGEEVPEADSHFDELFEKTRREYRAGFESFNMKKAIEAVVSLAREGNAYVDETKPWAMAKEEKMEVLAVVLGNLLALCREVAELLVPVMPEISAQMLEELSPEGLSLGEPLFPPLS